MDYYDMNRKMQKIKEDEAELEIKRPPFYSNQKRFDLPVKDNSKYIKISKIIIIKKKNNYLKIIIKMGSH